MVVCHNDCTAATPPTTDDVVDAVLDASRVLVAVAARSLTEQDVDISMQQYRALAVLAIRGPLRPVDLAAALGVDPSTATRLCDRLVPKRLISRRRQVHDRREVRLDLTPSGRQLVDRVSEQRRRHVNDICRAVPAAERATVARAFALFASAAESAVGPGDVADDTLGHTEPRTH